MAKGIAHQPLHSEAFLEHRDPTSKVFGFSSGQHHFPVFGCHEGDGKDENASGGRER